MGEMDAYKDIFLSESAEFIQSITDGLLALEAEPGDLEPVESVFRGAHSLKGMAAAMGYERTADLTHKMESLMDRVRAGERTPDSVLIDLMLEAVDAVRGLIDDEAADRNEIDPSGLISRIVEMTEESAPAQEAPADAVLAPLPRSSAKEGRAFRVVVTLEEGCVLKAVRAYMVIKRLSHMGEVLDTEPSTRELEDEQFGREFTVVLGTEASEPAVHDAVMAISEVEAAQVGAVEVQQLAYPTNHSEGPDVGSAEGRRRTAIPKLSETQTVRVAIGHLDNLVNLVGELVILRSRLDRVAVELQDRELTDAIEDLHRVAGELQHEVMHTRMVPVGNIFSRFPRMVRDLARDLGKDVDLQMSGLDIELDRTVLDEIGDPIVHLLRNSIDHGIESPEQREAAGKPRRGTVRLNATRERDNVHITVSDDGAGIACDRVWERAVELGLAAREDRDAYSDEQVLLFTCVPGFSTTSAANKVSGRGVGMDVVKGKIEHLGGSLRIESTPGAGSTFVLALPLTLAIVQALLIVSADQVFAAPLSAVGEVLAAEDVNAETVDGAPVVVMRDGEVVPVFSLDALLGLDEGPHRTPERGDHLVLLESFGARRALIVDELLGRREIVIKPLSRLFRSVTGLAGATVLGDGKVALIIDPRTVFPAREEKQ